MFVCKKILSLQRFLNMLLFHKERIFRNKSKLGEQESTSVNRITENSPKELDSKL